MKHELILLGKTKDVFIAEGIKEYSSRLNHYTKFFITVLKERGKPSLNQQGSQLLRASAASSLLVVLDENGRQFSSEEFSRKIGDWEMRGLKKICYLIGGPRGHAKKVVAEADLLLSFSKMTFTHDMIRMLLVEQLYRAYTIKAGEKYHK